MATIDLIVGYLPLVVVTLLAVPVALFPVSRRARLIVSRVGLHVFGQYVAERSQNREDQIRRMRAAFVGESHRVFASETLVIAAVSGVAGSVYGVYLGAMVLRSLALDPEVLREILPGPAEFLATVAGVPNLSPVQLFAVLLVTSATFGTALAAGTYWGRWTYLDQKARARGIEIDATLPRTVAFVYALSRSGIPFQAVLRTLSHNQDVYGEAARELGVAVRDMDAFGTDILTALGETAERTPSENLEEFTENLASVLSSGQSVSTYLHDQYDRFQEEAEAQQRRYLDLLATFAEGYVTVLVAGPLFFITILVVIGLVMQDTLTLVRLISYLAIPLLTFGFIVYVDSITEGLTAPGGETEDDTTRLRITKGAGLVSPGGGDDASPVTDGGTASGGRLSDRANRERLAVYDRIGTVRETLSDPVETILRQPVYSLFVTGPLGLLVFWLSLDEAALAAAAAFLSGPSSTEAVWELIAAIDGPIVRVALFVLGGIALSHEVQKRRLRRIEAEVPDFLERMASINEAGVTIVGSLERLSNAELGRLGDEIDRVWRDIHWGSNVESALARMEYRTGSPMVSRSMTLIRNAMAASGNIGPVLHIAADEAQETRRLRRERRQEMLTYLIVIYISFFVFLGIVTALTVSFIPAIEAAGQSGGVASGDVGGVDTGVLGGLQTVDTEAYKLLFFHTAAIQGVCSGTVAGQLGEGSVADGVKHATILLGIAYVVFAFL
ncbi:type II secretion system F family protein [Halobellus ordinarius]|uniref:type II secretion system F family protein n=1 Tax=Halobellus ordinarius TaxID=3075120 RepID=UPI0028807447|nr:type II secretion system F family protein [Halobellus sp. ZY16]